MSKKMKKDDRCLPKNDLENNQICSEYRPLDSLKKTVSCAEQEPESGDSFSSKRSPLHQYLIRRYSTVDNDDAKFIGYEKSYDVWGTIQHHSKTYSLPQMGTSDIHKKDAKTRCESEATIKSTHSSERKNVKETSRNFNMEKYIKLSGKEDFFCYE